MAEYFEEQGPSVEQELARIFRKNGWTWTIEGGRGVVPDETDILNALDEAVKMLYDAPVGAELEVGRLIIRKNNYGHDVFVLVGTY